MAFCSPDDIATRVGRDLTASELETVAQLCELATTEISAAAGKDDTWAADLDPVPGYLRTLAIELVMRADPSWQEDDRDGLSSVSETLGSWSYTERFESTADEGGAGRGLTRHEERLVRRVVYGTSVASVPVASIFDNDLPL